MARREKLSRIKGVPPRIQLTQRDAVTGSFPTIKRIASDNRKGGYGVFYDDGNSLVFSSSFKDIYLGTSLETTSTRYINTENTTSLIGTGSVVSSLNDVWITPYQDRNIGTIESQKLQPFRDFNQPAVDGKSNNDPFFATGSKESNVGEGGFDQPLWSKELVDIVVDFGPGSGGANGYLWQRNNNYFVSQKPNIDVSTFSYSKVYDYLDADYPYWAHGSADTMIYLNTVSSKWDTIGGRIAPFVDKYGAAPSMMYASGAIGFAPGFCVNYSPLGAATSKYAVSQSNFINSFFTGSLLGTTRSYDLLTGYCSQSLLYNNIEYMQQMGQPMGTYGFPYGPQYHANSQQTIKMKDYINKPFLIEKIVLQISGMNFVVDDIISSAPLLTTRSFYKEKGLIVPFMTNTVFVMNQKRNQSYKYKDPNIYAFNVQRKDARFAYNLQRENAITKFEQNAGTSSLVGEWKKDVTIPTYYSNYDQWQQWYTTDRFLGKNIEQTYVDTTRDLIAYGNIVSCPNEVTNSNHIRHMARPILYTLLMSQTFEEMFSNKYTNIVSLYEKFNTTFVLYPYSDMQLIWYASFMASALFSAGYSSTDVATTIRREVSKRYTISDVVVTQSYNLKDALNAECYVNTGKSLETYGTNAFSFSSDVTVPMVCKSPYTYGYFESAMKDILDSAISGSSGNVYDLATGTNISTLDGALSQKESESIVGSLKGGMADFLDYWKGSRNGTGFDHISTRDFLNSFGSENEGNKLLQFIKEYLISVTANQSLAVGDQEAYIKLANQYLELSDREKANPNPTWFGFDAVAPGQVDPDSYTNGAENICLFYNAHKINQTIQPAKGGKENPYLIYPEDELVIGWQMPLVNTLGYSTFLSMSVSGTYDPVTKEWQYGGLHQKIDYVYPNIMNLSFANEGRVRLFLYGSTLGENKPQSDSNTLNQLLTSNTIHEIIG